MLLQIEEQKKVIHHDYKEDDDDVDDWSNKTIYKIIILGTMYINVRRAVGQESFLLSPVCYVHSRYNTLTGNPQLHYYNELAKKSMMLLYECISMLNVHAKKILQTNRLIDRSCLVAC